MIPNLIIIPHFPKQLRNPGISVTAPANDTFYMYNPGSSLCMPHVTPDNYVHRQAQAWGIRPPSIVALYFALLQSRVTHLDK
jgi:hypothetical protein